MMEKIVYKRRCTRGGCATVDANLVLFFLKIKLSALSQIDFYFKKIAIKKSKSLLIKYSYGRELIILYIKLYL